MFERQALFEKRPQGQSVAYGLKVVAQAVEDSPEALPLASKAETA